MRMSSRIILRTVILVIVVSQLTPKASARTVRIPSIEVVNITETFGEDYKQTALLEMEIINNEKVPIVIPFRGIISKNAYKIIEPAYQTEWQGTVDGRSDNFLVADFAHVKYSWTDKNGFTYSQGAYDVSQDPVSISGGKRIKLFLPLRLPQKDGEFVFNLEFDNRSLSIPVLAGNRPNSIRYSFFKQCTNARITIKGTHK